MATFGRVGSTSRPNILVVRHRLAAPQQGGIFGVLPRGFQRELESGFAAVSRETQGVKCPSGGGEAIDHGKFGIVGIISSVYIDLGVGPTRGRTLRGSYFFSSPKKAARPRYRRRGRR
jgi:hypothetical protein